MKSFNFAAKRKRDHVISNGFEKSIPKAFYNFGNGASGKTFRKRFLPWVEMTDNMIESNGNTKIQVSIK